MTPGPCAHPAVGPSRPCLSLTTGHWLTFSDGPGSSSLHTAPERGRALPCPNPQLVLLQTLPPTLLTAARAWASSPAVMAMSIVVHAIPGSGSVNRTEGPKLREEGPHHRQRLSPAHTLCPQCSSSVNGPVDSTTYCAGLWPGVHRAMPGSA